MDNQSEASQGKIIPIVYAQGLAEERVKAVVSEKLAGRSFALCSYADTFYPDISIRKNVRMLRASTKGRERELFNELINLTGWKKKSSWIRPFRAHMTGEKRLFSVILTAILAGDALVLPEPFVGLDPDSRVQFSALISCCAAHGLTIILTLESLKDALEAGAAPELVLVTEGGERVVSRAAVQAKCAQEGEVSYDEIFRELAGM